MWFSSWLAAAIGNRSSAIGRGLRKPKAGGRNSTRFRPRLEILEDRCLPSTLTVLNTNDSGPGSLRAEIAAAQSGDTIVFDPSLAGQQIFLTSGQLVINTSLIIEGPPPHPETFLFFVEISASPNGIGLSRVFDITSSNANVTLDNLGIENGSANNGAGIKNGGTLTLNNCQVSGCVSGFPQHAGDGGGVDNTGTMFINNSTLFSNIAANGGAIANHGNMTITNSLFASNGAGNGSGIDNAGTLSVQGCLFEDLTGGFIRIDDVANFGTLTVTGSTFLPFGGEDALGNFGNAVLQNDVFLETLLNQANMTVTNCTISTPFFFGGPGIDNTGTMSLVGSTVSGWDSVGGNGGGIANSGTLTVSSSTITGNSANDGGGIFNTGTLYVTNGSNVTGNTAPSGADLYNLGTVQISSDSTVGVIGP